MMVKKKGYKRREVAVLMALAWNEGHIWGVDNKYSRDKPLHQGSLRYLQEKIDKIKMGILPALDLTNERRAKQLEEVL